MNRTRDKLFHMLHMRILLWGMVIALAGCELTSPEDATYDFINHFGAAKITTFRIVTYDFLANFSRGAITPSTISSILTPNGKPVYSSVNAQIDGQVRPGFIMIPPSQIVFDQVAIRETTVLEFGFGKYPGSDDGATGFVIVEFEGVKDTVYRRFLNTRDSLSHRRWFNEQIGLDSYVGRNVKITFAGSTIGTIAPGQFPPFLAWSIPVLKSSGAEGTPNGKGAFVAKNWETGGITRDAIITLAGSTAEFTLSASREGEVLYFGAGMKFLVGDGAMGLIVCEVSGRRDTVYRRFLTPRTRPDQRRWFDEVVSLTPYRGSDIRLIFSATTGPTDDASADWFAWSKPVLSLPRR